MIDRIQPPPRYLLGASLLFWGVMTDRWLLGGILALLIESSAWVKIRWNFDDEARAKAWQLCSIAIIVAGVMIFLEGTLYKALPDLLTWLPVLLMPMQFVQVFGFESSMPLNTFSFLAKSRRRRNLRLGLPESEVYVNFGNIYFVGILIGTTLGDSTNLQSFSPFYLPGIALLTAWRLLASSKRSRWSLILALVAAGGLAVLGQRGIDELEARFKYGGGNRDNPNGFDPKKVTTKIGQPVTVTQSSEILWRVKAEGSTQAPTLLRLGTYNMYKVGKWFNLPPDVNKFTDLTTMTVDGEPFDVITPEDRTPKTEATSASLPRFTLRGSSSEYSPLPLPGDATSMTGFDLDTVESNQLGTVRVFPRHSVIEGTVLFHGAFNPDAPPIDNVDTPAVPLDHEPGPVAEERTVFRDILSEIHWDAQPDLRAKLGALQAWFSKNFTYTRELSIQGSTRSQRRRPPIVQFLTDQRAGHCEYFATATALILREAGIPARYATGFAVFEHNPHDGGFIIRGTHGHAWCRVWDEANQHWIDFDTTPPSWHPDAMGLNSSTQAFNDALKRWREDFFLWRNRPANRLAVTLVMSGIGLAVAAFVFSRLWKSKQRLDAQARSGGYAGAAELTPLNALERAASKLLEPRDPGVPFARWFRRLHERLPSAPVEEAVKLHQQLRFDPQPAGEDERERLAKLAAEIGAAIKKA